MSKLSKLTLPVAILITGIILGGFYYASQVNKQKSIERQQEIKLLEDRKTEEVKKKTDCSSIARAAFKSYEESKKNKDGSSNWSYSYEVFGYSPSFDTCVFSVEEILTLDLVVDSRIIVDAYTNREIVDWTIWNDVIENIRKKEGNDAPIVSGFDSEQKTNKEIFQRIYSESF
ncbi:MAG: hypothetical protein A3A97_01205 [Candidatus Terrybacteria bacterium RIFCSPLOWO2_01_FULL_40_23]|uniref:Uncharacterized protein n=1 Tax=Candidatus Terrybacteria bacterium RIFCSPLOWO2_01_FULL_40_23 TaxID=1802366 RepID=A0A1G2PYS3_9BACT|nr:MAG: hypothetical protein A3A97_01205 [Candidatus Terrybacteria bacterium RIFCSPLOWO2_01_FULL_40_23]